MIITTVVLTNAAQAKCFSLSMPITYVCSHTSDLEPQLCLEPKWRSMELVKQHQQDLRTATQFRHGAWRVLTSPIWVALFIMRSKHHKTFHWPRLQLRNRVVHSFTCYHYTVHPGSIVRKVKHSSSNRSTHPYAGVYNTQSSSHLTTSEQSSCRICASRSCHP